MVIAILVGVLLLAVGPLADADTDDDVPGWGGCHLDGTEMNGQTMAADPTPIVLPKLVGLSLVDPPTERTPISGAAVSPGGPRAPPVGITTPRRSCALNYCVSVQLLRSAAPSERDPRFVTCEEILTDWPSPLHSLWHSDCGSPPPLLRDQTVDAFSSPTEWAVPLCPETAGRVMSSLCNANSRSGRVPFGRGPEVPRGPCGPTWWVSEADRKARRGGAAPSSRLPSADSVASGWPSARDFHAGRRHRAGANTGGC
jgi:hypothetical protein